MSTGTIASFDALVSSALALPPEQRVELAERLWMSVEGTFEDEALFAEIDRREAEIESGAVQPISFDQAMSDNRNQISK
jgi:putative addiction module component (TIGR02574 family)